MRNRMRGIFRFCAKRAGKKKKACKRTFLRPFAGFYAADGGRTRTLSPERDFKSLVSANFTTAAQIRLTTVLLLCCAQRAGGAGAHI